MSIKAMNWAMEQETGDPRAQCLLYVIADCASEEGLCWPSADWMAAKSQQSRATVYRRLDALQAVGLLIMFPRWIDENGKISNAAAPGRRRTSPEIRLQLAAMVKRPPPSEASESESEDEEGSSQAETTQSHSSDRPVSLQRQGSSHCSDNNHHLNRLEESPPTPSGGDAPDDWKRFEDAWREPILRQSLARPIWTALNASERDLLCRAAQGYDAWLAGQKKPPTRLAAHRFMKERDAWERYANYAPTAVAAGSHPLDSPEGRAIAALFGAAGLDALMRATILRHGVLYCRIAVTPRVLAFGDLPPREQWPAINRQQAGAWDAFFRETLPNVASRQPVREGVHMPHEFPPRVDGTWSPPTGPPVQAEASEDDLADFH